MYYAHNYKQNACTNAHTLVMCVVYWYVSVLVSAPIFAYRIKSSTMRVYTVWLLLLYRLVRIYWHTPHLETVWRAFRYGFHCVSIMSDKMFSRFGCVRRKRIYLSILCISLCFLCINYLNNNNQSKDITILKTCFIPTQRYGDDNITLFEDILEAKKKPIPDRSVFFIESSCVRNGLAALTAR